LCFTAAVAFVEEPLLFILFMIVACMVLVHCEDFKKWADGNSAARQGS
jgi:hypothetical protein